MPQYDTNGPRVTKITGFLAVLAAFALAFAGILMSVGTAGAAITDDCTTAPNGISMFPDAPFGQSTLQVSCIVSTTTGGGSAFYKTEDFDQAQWHWGGG